MEKERNFIKTTEERESFTKKSIEKRHNPCSENYLFNAAKSMEVMRTEY